MKIKTMIICIIVTVSSMLTGCNNRTSIEDRDFVISVGIDKVDDKGKSGEEDRFKVTVCIANVVEITKNNKNSVITKSEKGVTITQAIKKLANFSKGELDFKHTKVVVIDRKVLEDEKLVRELLDVLERNMELSQKSIIVTCENGAENLLQDKIDGGQTLGQFVNDYYKNNDRAVTTAFSKNLSETISTIDVTGGVILPNVEIVNKSVVIKNGSIIGNYKFNSVLEEKLAIGYVYVTGNAKGIEIVEKIDNAYVPLEIESHKHKKYFVEENGKLYYVVDVSINGTVNEYLFGETLDKTKLDEIAGYYDEVIEKNAVQSYEFIRDTGVDSYVLKEGLRKYDYELYCKYVVGREAEFLKEIDIVVNSEVKIVSKGAIE